MLTQHLAMVVVNAMNYKAHELRPGELTLQTAPCTNCGPAVIAATPAPVNACCNNGTSRPQVVSGFRNRVQHSYFAA